MRCCVGTDPLVSLGSGLAGIAAGSLLNWVIWRIPPHDRPEDIPEAFDKQLFVRGPAKCERCGVPLRRWQTTGVVALLAGRTRCPQCGRLTVVPRLLVEVGCAVVWFLSAWFLGATMAAATVAVFATLLLGIAVSDFRSWTIPHEFTWVGIVVGLLSSLVQGTVGFLGALAGVLVGPAIFFLVGWLVAKYKRIPVGDALGFGDYWLIGMIGAFIGWKMVPIAIMLSAVIGLVVALPGAIRATVLRVENPKIPFGVFLALGGAATLLVGDRLVAWYIHSALGK